MPWYLLVTKVFAFLLGVWGVFWNARRMVKYCQQEYTTRTYHLKCSPEALRTALEELCPHSWSWTGIKAKFKSSCSNHCRGFVRMKPPAEGLLLLWPLLGGRNSLRPCLKMSFDAAATPDECTLQVSFCPPIRIGALLAYYIAVFDTLLLAIFLFASSLQWTVRLAFTVMGGIVTVAGPWLIIYLCRNLGEEEVEKSREPLEDMLYDIETKINNL